MADKRFRDRAKRSSTLYWRTDRNSEGAKYKHDNTQVRVHAKTANHPQRITLKQLCSEDKCRVRQLIQELASTGVEREKVEERLREERGRFQELLARATQQCQELARERNQLEIELADSQLQLQAVQSLPPTHSHPHTHSHAHVQTYWHSDAGHTEEQYLEKPLRYGSGNSPTVEHSGRSRNFLSPSSHVQVNLDLDTQASGPQLAVVGLDTHPPMMSAAQPSVKSTVGITSITHPQMKSSAILMTSTAHPPMTPSAVAMTSTAHSPMTPLTAPMTTTPHSPMTSSAAPMTSPAHPPMRSSAAPMTSTAHSPTTSSAAPMTSTAHRHNLPVSMATEVAARSMQQGVPAYGGLQPSYSYQAPVSSVAASHPPHHSSLNDFKAPSEHSTTSYPLYTEVPHAFLRPVPERDTHTRFLTSRLPTFCKRPQQSIPTWMGHVTRAETGTANSETFAQQQPQESDAQSPSLGVREFVEHYRPESRTPPVDEWTSLPPATPQFLEDGGAARGQSRALQSDSSDDEPAPDNYCKILHPHVVSHGTQTATAEPDSVQLSNQPSSAVSVSTLLSVHDTNTDPNTNETKDRGVQTMETDHVDSHQLISDSGKENSYLSHTNSSLKPTTVQAVVSTNKTRDGKSWQATTSASSSADLKPVEHSRMLKARAMDGHPRSLSPILPSKLVPTPSSSSGVQTEGSSVNEAHLESLMASAVLNAQDTIRSLARLNWSLERGSDSRGDFPDVMALNSGLERSPSPSDLLAPGTSVQANLSSQTLFPQKVSRSPDGYPAHTASTLRKTSSAEKSCDLAAAKGTVLHSRTAQKSHTRATLQGRVRQRLREKWGTGRDHPESGLDDGDRDIIEELFFII